MNAKDSKHRLILAKLLSKQPGRENDVISLLDEVIEIKPSDTLPLVLKTSFLLTTQQYHQAMKVADYTQKHFPELALGWQLQGDIYIKQDDIEHALESYRQAYYIQPKQILLMAIAELEYDPEMGNTTITPEEN